MLPADLRGIVDNRRATIAQSSVRSGVFAPNPRISGLKRIAARDGKGHVAVFSGRENAIAWLLDGSI